jgi:hypothetical protein
MTTAFTTPEEGAWWVSGRTWSRPERDCALPGSSSRVCRDYGIVVCQREAGLIVLEWDVERAEEAAVSSVIDFVREHAGDRVILRFYMEGWAQEHFCDSERAGRRIARLQGQRALERGTRGTIVEQPLDRFQGTSVSAEPLVVAALSAWRDGPGIFPELMSSTRLGHQAVVFERRGPNDPLRYRSVGRRSDFRRLYGRGCAEAVIGLEPALPTGSASSESESLMSEGYDEALRRASPVYHHGRVNLVVGSERYWIPFQRLVVPVLHATGQGAHELVYSFAKITDDVLVPFLDA